MSAISDATAQKLAQIRELNKTVWEGYLNVLLDGEIQLVYISAYLQYLERTNFRGGTSGCMKKT